MARPDHLPLELLQTFTVLVDQEGDAAAAAEKLGITQPSISKRLNALRRLTTASDRQPWLLLRGRRWHLTAEGQRVREVVGDLVHRYELMEQFVAGGMEGGPTVALACGRQAADGLVRIAVERFLRDHPEARVRVSTPRGRARIEGVAGGRFEFALVTDGPQLIGQIAKREMFIEDLLQDQFALVANPSAKAEWGEKWRALPTDRPVKAAELMGLPFVLPEPDASLSQRFQQRFLQAAGKPVRVVLETGGWRTIWEYAMAGVAIGLTTRGFLHAHQPQGTTVATTLMLDPIEFPPDAVRFIARKAHGKIAPELSTTAERLRQFVKRELPPRDMLR